MLANYGLLTANFNQQGVFVLPLWDKRYLYNFTSYKPFAPLVHLSLSTPQLIPVYQTIKIPQRGKRFVEITSHPLPEPQRGSTHADC
jgi:hypothetical protein